MDPAPPLSYLWASSVHHRLSAVKTHLLWQTMGLAGNLSLPLHKAFSETLQRADKKHQESLKQWHLFTMPWNGVDSQRQRRTLRKKEMLICAWRETTLQDFNGRKEQGSSDNPSTNRYLFTYFTLPRWPFHLQGVSTRAICQPQADYQQIDPGEDDPSSPPKINFSQVRSSFSWSLPLDQPNEIMEMQHKVAV